VTVEHNIHLGPKLMKRRMMEKLRDEQDALMICREKVLQRGLPMVIVDAEYQW